MTADRRYYIAIEVDFFDHQKVVALGEVIALKHLRAVAWCHRQLTDGFIPAPAIGALRITKREASALVRANLWEAVTGGWRIHDYLKHQPGRDEMRTKSDAARNAARMRWAMRSASEPHGKRIAETMPTYYVPRTTQSDSSSTSPVVNSGDAVRSRELGRVAGFRPIGDAAARVSASLRTTEE